MNAIEIRNLSKSFHGLYAVDKGKIGVIPGLLNRILVFLGRCIPHALLLKVMKVAQSKRQG